jgi:signal transduction histidine kinase
MRGTALGLSLLLLGALSVALQQGQANDRRDLVERFELRASFGARFLHGYVNELTAREQTQARIWLADSAISQASFRRVVSGFGFRAAVLLDHDGRLLRVFPDQPELLGQNLSAYEHLRLALEGQVAVSNVVPSAALASPVVAFAVPFETPSGRRVFSGTLSVADTTIGTAYLKSLYPYGATAYLIDDHGAIIATSLTGPLAATRLHDRDPRLDRALTSGYHGSYQGPNGTARFAFFRVTGTRWRLVVSTPDARVFAPIGGFSTWGPWVSFGGLVLLVLVVVLLALRLAEARGREVRAKEDLISHVSHELRTPLTAIHGFTMTLLDGVAGELTADQRSYLEILFRNTQQLTRMVNDLLDSAKVQGGKLSLSVERVRVTDVVEAVIQGFIGRAAVAGVHLHAHIPSDLPDLDADPSRFEQVVSNLLDNALKFTPPGGRVAIDAGRVPDDEGLVWVAVSDTGPGIPAAEQEHLFERLYQGRTGEGSRKGLGLGLFISRGIVERQGGRLDVGTSESGGARFTLTLPVWTGAERSNPSVLAKA